MSLKIKCMRELNQALVRLYPDQGRVARRNARKRVLQALSDLRKAIDAEYPAIRKEPRKRLKPINAVRRKIAKLTERGYAAMAGLSVALAPEQLAQWAELGIRVHTVRFPGQNKNNPVFVPLWAVMAKDERELRRCMRSASERERLRALYWVVTAASNKAKATRSK